MSTDAAPRRRRSIRLPEYDYTSPGAYFVTICVQDRECALGEVVEGEMVLSAVGQIVSECWHAIPDHFPHAELGPWVVMPNHVHGIIVIEARAPVGAPVGAQHAAPLPARVNVQPGSLGAIVRSFKSGATRRINQLRGTPSRPFWQRNYWEHIVRNEITLRRICKYIETNPARWAEDRLHPNAPSGLSKDG